MASSLDTSTIALSHTEMIDHINEIDQAMRTDYYGD